MTLLPRPASTPSPPWEPQISNTDREFPGLKTQMTLMSISSSHEPQNRYLITAFVRLLSVHEIWRWISHWHAVTNFAVILDYQGSFILIAFHLWWADPSCLCHSDKRSKCLYLKLVHTFSPEKQRKWHRLFVNKLVVNPWFSEKPLALKCQLSFRIFQLAFVIYKNKA
jgi:hypothetical protein